MTRFALALSLLAATCAHAQTTVRITDPAALVPQPELALDASAQAGLKAAGISPEAISEINLLSDSKAWPIGLRTDSARAANSSAVGNYTAFKVRDYANEDGAFSIVSVPASFNFHMPDDLRAKGDFFLVFRAGALQAKDTDLQREKPSKGPSWQRLRPARIIRPDAVYATYDLADDAEALSALERQGLSQSEVEAVVFRSHERNWPEGIDNFEKRYPKLKRLRKYKAFRLAKWGDKVLLVIPAERNKSAQEGLRPFIDVYMVFAADAVKVKEGK